MLVQLWMLFRGFVLLINISFKPLRWFNLPSESFFQEQMVDELLKMQCKQTGCTTYRSEAAAFGLLFLVRGLWNPQEHRSTSPGTAGKKIRMIVKNKNSEKKDWTSEILNSKIWLKPWRFSPQAWTISLGLCIKLLKRQTWHKILTS